MHPRLPASDFVSEPARSPIADVVLTIGGAKAPAVNHHSQSPEAIVCAFDNPKDMAGRLPLHESLGVISVSIGEGHTSFTLFAKASLAKQRGSRKTANTAVHTGMGANAVVGAQAATLYTGSPEAKAFAESLVERVLEQTAGSPELIRVRFLFSFVGGTGAGMFEPLARHIADAFRKIGVPVAFELDALGPICFTGVSKTCRLNAGAVLPALISFVTDNSDPDFDLVTRRLDLSELPPLGQRRDLRDQLVVLEEQALTAPQFRDRREEVTSNAATQDALGGIFLRETDFVAWLDPVKHIRPAVSAVLYAHVRQQLEAVAVDPALFRKEIWEDDAQERPRATVESIASRSSSYTFPAFRAAICQESVDHRFRLVFTLDDGSRFDAHYVDQLCCVPPTSLDDAIARLQLLASTVETAVEISAECEATIALIEADQVAAGRRLEAAFNRVRRGGGWFSSVKRACEQLINRGTLDRDLSDERSEWRAKLNEARHVAQKAERELRKLRHQLQAIERTLAKYLPDTGQLAIVEYVRVREPNAAFPALLRLIGESKKRQTDILCSLADAVTLQGLAVMLGAKFVDLQEIAQHIVAGRPAFRSPPFGGVRRQSEAKTIFALPPLDEPFSGLLSEAIARIRQQAVVVFGETMASGAGVLRVRYRNVHSLEEIFVGLLKHNTVEAHTRPDREMICLGGEESVHNLGISINGDMTFPDALPNRFPPELQP